MWSSATVALARLFRRGGYVVKGGPEGPPLDTRQPPNQFVIGGRKVQGRQLIACHPVHLLANHRPRGTNQIATIEEERHDAVRVVVRRFEDEVPYDDVDVELLVDLAAQRLCVRLAIRYFAAWEFPESGEMNAVLPPRHEKPTLPLDDGSDDQDARHCAGL